MNIQPANIYIQEYSYSLPADRIADHPLAQRDESKLLIFRDGDLEEDRFKNAARHVPADATLILNNTKVIEARLFFQKATGGVIEIFCLEPDGPYQNIAQTMAQTEKTQWQCLIGGASKWKPGQLLHKEIVLEGTPVQLTARYVEKRADCFAIEFFWAPSHYAFAEVLHAAGAIPLPPYIKRAAEVEDADRYQTIFARHEGSVAAPTAALHFTEQVMETLKDKGVLPQYITLHVGAGTFKPVKSETIADHAMHAEHFSVSKATLRALQQPRPIVAVGTTSLRTLESLYWIGIKLLHNPELSPQELVLQQWEAYELESKGISYADSLQAILNYIEGQGADEVFCQTSLLIVPGYTFHSASALFTNFHQPQSTLLLLVAAFIGEKWRKVYDHALAHDYRFLSYGDSSLLFRADLPPIPSNEENP
ncbi:S-adenosylmethionine:tRNA ribosyltransferase-isomerase [Paraflavisolibacter sp. H34]|uniref:S-adenosylmethionine:tRNA ribosyltransferase-isomerase n=1 Tax=Huijunlia imazamoxiresistens TaxID=3127457 RepID=UPI0030169BBA